MFCSRAFFSTRKEFANEIRISKRRVQPNCLDDFRTGRVASAGCGGVHRVGVVSKGVQMNRYRNLAEKLHSVICAQTQEEIEARRIASAFAQVNELNAQYDMSNVYRLIRQGHLRLVKSGECK